MHSHGEKWTPVVHSQGERLSAARHWQDQTHTQSRHTHRQIAYQKLRVQNADFGLVLVRFPTELMVCAVRQLPASLRFCLVCMRHIGVLATEAAPTSRCNALTSTLGLSDGCLVDILYTTQAKDSQNARVTGRKHAFAFTHVTNHETRERPRSAKVNASTGAVIHLSNTPLVKARFLDSRVHTQIQQ